MPSQKILTEKQAYVAELKAKIQASVAGLCFPAKLEDVAVLRFAIDECGYKEMEKTLEGTTAIAISKEDPMVAAKILCKFAEDSKGKFTVKSGYMDGAEMTAAEVEAIAKLPGRQELLSMLCSALQGNIRGLAVALNAIAEKSEEVA